MALIGISDSFIAAIFYSAANGLLNDSRAPLKNAMSDTCAYFSKQKSIEIELSNFEKIIMGNIAQDEINKFKDGEKFIDGDKLAMQFAIFGDLYLENQTKTLGVAKEIISYFKDSFVNYLLKNPETSAITLSKIQQILFNTLGSDHIQILEEFIQLKIFIQDSIKSGNDDIQEQINKTNQILSEKFELLEQQNSEIKSSVDSITDVDLKVLNDRISNIPEDKRFRFGIVDIYGIPISFIKNDFKTFMKTYVKPIIEAKMNLDNNFVTGIAKKATSEIADMGHLLYISPFTRQVAMPYVFDKIVGKFHSHSTPIPLGEKYFKTKASDDEIIEEIKNRLILIAEKVLKNDFSDFREPPHLFAYKKKLATYIHKDFSSIDEIIRVFNKEISFLKEVLTPLIKKYAEMVETPTTVVVKDANIFETKGMLDLMMRTVQEIDGGSGKIEKAT